MQARTTACLALILVLPASTRANDSSADDHGDTAQGSDWQLYNGNLDATRFSPLRQINHRNVGSLREIPDVELPETTAFVSGLLVIDHVLFVTTPGSTYAIDATAAKILWSYDSHPKSLGLGTGNRGAAYANGRIYRGTPDDHLIALDAKTGRRLWDVQAFDPAKGEYIVAAPIVWQNNLYIGNAGSDVAAIGHVRAFDLTDGRQLWDFDNVPASGPGSETWPSDPSDHRAGGGIYSSLALDAAASEY
jgi:alcohol dehydrogenase (cytochrome c)